MKDARLLRGLLASIGLVSLIGVGCPGRLKDPEEFLQSCDANYDVPRDLFKPTCGQSTICHSPAPDGGVFGGGLDLVSPGVGGRLIGKPSTSALCSGRTLVTSADAGLLFDKLLEPIPPCGTQMPQIPPLLTNDQIFCIRQWVAAQIADGGGI
jgi:hypothetical protein